MELKQGMLYQADVTLSFLESMASNNIIADKLRLAGFSNVIVTGKGNTRNATGYWNLPSQKVELPKQVSNVKLV